MFGLMSAFFAVIAVASLIAMLVVEPTCAGVLAFLISMGIADFLFPMRRDSLF